MAKKAPGKTRKRPMSGRPAKPASKTTVTRRTKAATKAGTKAGIKRSTAKLPAKTETSGRTAAKASKAAGKGAASAGVAAGGPAEGTRAPDFSLPRDGGKTVALKDFVGKALVLYFYPRADTPGCTREAMDFTRLRPEFASAGAEVVGVSADPLRAQDAFRDKYDLAIPLASDESRDTIEAYGAWGEKSMYGRVFLGILRTTVLIGPDGRIARIWRNVKVDGHAEQVLDAVRALD